MAFSRKRVNPKVGPPVAIRTDPHSAPCLLMRLARLHRSQRPSHHGPRSSPRHLRPRRVDARAIRSSESDTRPQLTTAARLAWCPPSACSIRGRACPIWDHPGACVLPSTVACRAVIARRPSLLSTRVPCLPIIPAIESVLLIVGSRRGPVWAAALVAWSRALAHAVLVRWTVSQSGSCHDCQSVGMAHKLVEWALPTRIRCGCRKQPPTFLDGRGRHGQIPVR